VINLDQGGRLRGIVHSTPVPGSIAHVVERIWIDRTEDGVPAGRTWRVVPDDAPHVIVALHRDDHRRAAGPNLVGARRTAVDVDRSARVATVAARLRPGAIPALFGIPAAAVTDRALPIELLSPRFAGAGVERWSELAVDDVPSMLGSLFERLVARGRSVDRRARWLHALAPDRPHDVGAIAGQFGVTDRALRAWSERHLGMSVKRFLRVRRLHCALDLGFRHPECTWSTVAARAGFADHSHFVRDCRALIDEPPTTFASRGRAQRDFRFVQAGRQRAG
jgi:AraC-like DNA-binding protein